MLLPGHVISSVFCGFLGRKQTEIQQPNKIMIIKVLVTLTAIVTCVRGFGVQKDAYRRELDKYLRSKFVTFAKRGFEANNKFRAMHHSPPLKWSDKLAARAQKLAYQMALNGTIQAPGVDQLGENRAKLSAVNYDCELAGEEASRIWYSQGGHYSYSDPRLNSDTDSFTQLIWKDSREMGMGCAQRKGSVTNEIYVVALYYPPGNSEVTLRENVLDPKKMSSKDVYATIYRRGHLEQHGK